MRRFIPSLLLMLTVVSFVGCSSKKLTGSWKVTKASGQRKAQDINRLEFYNPHQIGYETGELALMQNDGTIGYHDYSAYENRSPKQILMSIYRDDEIISYYGIYKFDGRKLILKVVQNIGRNDPDPHMPGDFNEQSGFDILELERDNSSPSLSAQRPPPPTPEPDYSGAPSRERTSSKEWEAYVEAFQKFSAWRGTYRLTETKADSTTTIYVTEVDGAGNRRITVDGEEYTTIVGKKQYNYWHGKWTESKTITPRFGALYELSMKLMDVLTPAQETLNGVNCMVYPTRYRGGYKGKLWVGVNDGLPHQLDGAQEYAKWHVVFEYGADIKIKKPVF
jgi:hypothetical protein